MRPPVNRAAGAEGLRASLDNGGQAKFPPAGPAMLYSWVRAGRTGGPERFLNGAWPRRQANDASGLTASAFVPLRAPVAAACLVRWV
jgi:hypothetical protein